MEAYLVSKMQDEVVVGTIPRAVGTKPSGSEVVHDTMAFDGGLSRFLIMCDQLLVDSVGILVISYKVLTNISL